MISPCVVETPPVGVRQHVFDGSGHVRSFAAGASARNPPISPSDTPGLKITTEPGPSSPQAANALAAIANITVR
jgi:hypothetical protein